MKKKLKDTIMLFALCVSTRAAWLSCSGDGVWRRSRGRGFYSARSWGFS